MLLFRVLLCWVCCVNSTQIGEQGPRRQSVNHQCVPCSAGVFTLTRRGSEPGLECARRRSQQSCQTGNVPTIQPAPLAFFCTDV